MPDQVIETTTNTNVAPVQAVKAIILQTLDFDQFMSANGFNQVNKDVSLNKNGIPFVTFLKPGATPGAKSEALTVFFSLSTSPTVVAAVKASGVVDADNKPVLPIVKGFLRGYSYQQLQYPVSQKYPQGVIMWKISAKGGKRLDLADL